MLYTSSYIKHKLSYHLANTDVYPYQPTANNSHSTARNGTQTSFPGYRIVDVSVDYGSHFYNKASNND